MITQTTRNNTFSFRVYRRARIAQDVRYDGLFFSGASTTKIYCRPICPGKPPLESNNIFFQSRAQAEGAGFRPCLRCRPELAPGHSIQKAAGWQVRHALGRIHQGLLPNKAFEAQAAPIKAPPGLVVPSKCAEFQCRTAGSARIWSIVPDAGGVAGQANARS